MGTFREKRLARKETSTPVGSFSPIDDAITMVLDLRDAKEAVETFVHTTHKAVNEELAHLEDAINKVADTESLIEDIREEALVTIKEIKKGDPGKDADEERIIEKVLVRIPPVTVDTESIINETLSRIPVVNEDALIQRFKSLIPDRKADLKIIQESVEVDPMSVIDKILALPEEKKKKFKLSIDNIDGLEQTISAFRNQIGNRGYLHGGGISNITGLVQAGTNITITGQGTTTSPYVVNATATGSVNSVTGLNTDNTDPTNPIVQISVDDFTVKGLGTPASPLTAYGRYTQLSGNYTVLDADNGMTFSDRGTAVTFDIDLGSITVDGFICTFVTEENGFGFKFIFGTNGFLIGNIPVSSDITSANRGNSVTIMYLRNKIYFSITGTCEYVG